MKISTADLTPTKIAFFCYILGKNIIYPRAKALKYAYRFFTGYVYKQEAT
jgi:hypothetical protein